MFLLKENHKNRNTAYRRQQRRKHIKRKKKILKEINFLEEDFFTRNRIGQLDKGKVHCSCKMCKYEKHFDIPKSKYQLSEYDKEILKNHTR